jgi:hypothetical protein
MTDAAIASITGSALLFAGLIAQTVLAEWRATRQAARNVRADKAIAEVSKDVTDVKKIVNGAAIPILRQSADALQALADNTKRPADIARAESAGKSLEEHKAVIDAMGAEVKGG